jgi:hypothetical protein
VGAFYLTTRDGQLIPPADRPGIEAELTTV